MVPPGRDRGRHAHDEGRFATAAVTRFRRRRDDVRRRTTVEGRTQKVRRARRRHACLRRRRRGSSRNCADADADSGRCPVDLVVRTEPVAIDECGAARARRAVPRPRGPARGHGRRVERLLRGFGRRRADADYRLLILATSAVVIYLAPRPKASAAASSQAYAEVEAVHALVLGLLGCPATAVSATAGSTMVDTSDGAHNVPGRTYSVSPHRPRGGLIGLAWVTTNRRRRARYGAGNVIGTAEPTGGQGRVGR